MTESHPAINGKENITTGGRRLAFWPIFCHASGKSIVFR